MVITLETGWGVLVTYEHRQSYALTAVGYTHQDRQAAERHAERLRKLDFVLAVEVKRVTIQAEEVA